MLYKDYLQSKDVVNLSNYKYNSCEYTWLDKKMNDWWLYAVEWMPRVKK